MRQTIFGFTWAYSRRQQLTLLAVTCLSFPLVYMILEVPKWIINDAIGGKDFPKEFLGFQFEQLPYLFLLSGVFMLLIVANNGVKYVLNVYKGIVGERMLRRLRYQLFEATLRFRPRAFRKVSGDQLIPMITSEVEDLGHFFSEAVATPAFQGGSLLVYIIFIFVQNVWLGLVAVSLYPLQAWLIPHLQKQVSLLARDRVRNLRVVADRVGSSVNSAEILHVAGTRGYHLADFSDHLHENYRIRLAIYKKKYVIKFLNNFMNQMPPFIFYGAGGYFVINGELTLGALVVCISAYQDISGPWKDLLGYYQRYAMAAIKYTTIIENFRPEDRFPDSRFEAGAEPVTLAGGLPLALRAISLDGGEGAGKLSDLEAEVAAGDSLAVVGDDESGRSQLLQAMAGLLPLGSGRIEIGGQNLAGLREAEIGARIGYSEQEPYLFDASLRANLAYPLRARQLDNGDLPSEEAHYRAREARLTGNAPEEVKALWTDFARAGVADAAGLDARMVMLMNRLGMGEDLIRLGLAHRLDPTSAADLVAKLLRVRAGVRAEIAADPTLAGLVDFWDRDAINASATLASNLLFGFPSARSGGIPAIVADPAVQEVLRSCDLLEPLLAVGAEAAETMIRLFLDSDDDAYSPAQEKEIPKHDLEALRRWLPLYKETGGEDLDPAGRDALLTLALRLRPRRHRLHALSDAVLAKILAARAAIKADWPDFSVRYASFDPDSYVPSMDIEHNLLQGKILPGKSEGRSRIFEVVRRWILKEDLAARIAAFGLDLPVGVGGRALSAHQRHIVGLARALIVRPPLMIADLGDRGTTDLVKELRALQTGTLVVGLARPSVAEICSQSVELGTRVSSDLEA
ncbi:MAG: ABC transporter ATP-binding protein [Rhodospirillales bacterium]